MSELTDRIAELEHMERSYHMLLSKVREDLTFFLGNWAEPETRLPKNRDAQVLPITRLLTFVGED